MTERALALAQRLRADLAELDEVAATSPADADAIAVALIVHVTSWRPRPLTTPAPDHEPRDPRERAG